MTKITFKELTEDEQQVLESLTYKPSTKAAIEKSIGKNPTGAIAKLRAEGLIQVKVGKGYEILPRGVRVFQKR